MPGTLKMGLTIVAFGAISDNVGGIAEMSQFDVDRHEDTVHWSVLVFEQSERNDSGSELCPDEESDDLTTCEFASRCVGYKSNHVWSGQNHLGIHEYVGHPLVDAVDWTLTGAVTPVETTDSAARVRRYLPEGARFIAISNVSPLSEQQLVECDVVDSGCNGELMDNALTFCREICHLHGDRLQLHCNRGRSKSFELHRWVHPGKCRETHERVQ